jgi:hypothetical protein
VTSAIRAILLLIIFWPATGQADLRMNDFSYGLRLASPDHTPLVKLVVPKSVYRHLVRADAGDIRIFTMDGRMLPHLLRRPVQDDQTLEARHLPLFPLYRESTATGSPDVRIQTDASGAVLRLNPPMAEIPERPAPAYLIDASQLDQGLDRLILSWQRLRPDVLIKARLEASSDLVQWRSVLAAVTLADIRHGDNRVQNRTISWPSAQPPAAYLRLTWLSGGDAIRVERVDALPRPRGNLPQRYWVRAAYRSDLVIPGGMQFDSGGFFPVDRVDLELPRGNSLLTGTVKSRESERAVWRVHFRGPFYHLQVNDTTLHNDPVAVPETTDRFWQLDIDNRQSGLGAGVPRLKLGGRPHELFFAPQGGGTYIMAYGSRKAMVLEPPPDLVARVASETSIARADIGRRIALGGSARRTGPGRDNSGRMVSLSTWLLALVLLLAFLAWWVMRRRLHR